eukprot:8591524-Pyramimonas_sp.AAC.1
MNRALGLTLARIMTASPPGQVPDGLMEAFVASMCVSPNTIRRSRMAGWRTQSMQEEEVKGSSSNTNDDAMTGLRVESS